MTPMQTTITFPVHSRENNARSQAHLDSNRKRFSNQCQLVYDWLMTGKTLTRKEAMNLLDIRHLPRRIADLREAGIDVKDKPAGNGRGKYNVYYLQNIQTI